MRATEANFGHIFMLFSDPDRAADRAVAAAIEGKAPDVKAADADENEHRMWRVTDPATISSVQGALAGKDLYIADGHHRYETAVNYMRECEAAGWKPAAAESFDVRMMTLFNIDEPGMSIRPIHRMVHGVDGFTLDEFLLKAEEQFVVERFASLADMLRATAEGASSHTFGCATRDGLATLQLRREVDPKSLVSGERSEDYARLDVSVLHSGILDRLLGIGARALEEQTNVTYTVDVTAGMSKVEAGEEQMLLVLNATSAAEVVRVADHGEKMPQKSTDFYPKLLTGMVLSVMEIDKGS
jgi:uncharacterized protein (DUF1015 family)